MLNKEAIFIIFKKEILCFLKNKEALFIMILVPILIYPAIFLISGDAMAQMMIKKTSTPLEISVIQISNEDKPISSELVEMHSFFLKHLILKETESTPKKKLKLEYLIKPIETAVTEPALKEDDQIQVLFYPQDSNNKKGEVRICYNSENDLAFAGKSQVQSLIEDFNMILFKRILKENNISIEMMQPIVIKEAQNISPSEHSVIKYGGALLAILLIFLTYVSCQYAATEVIPAEREQFTLETLLATPLQWHNIIIGKYLAIVVSGFFNALLNLIGMLIFGGSIIASMANMSQENFQFNITFVRILLILFSLIPLAFMCAAVSMFLISFARTRMSASYFSVPGMLLVIAPAMLTLMPNTQLQGLWIILPFANMTLYIRNLILGDVSWLISLAVIANVVFFSLVITFFSISISNQKDKILSGGMNFTLFHRPKTIQDSLTIFEGVFIFIISVAMYYTIGQFISTIPILGGIGLPISFFICFFAPSFLFMRFKNVNIKTFLNFHLPTWQQTLGAVLFVVPLVVITGIFAALLSTFVPEISESTEMVKFVNNIKDKYGLVGLILIVAVTPGLFEEFIMRGVFFHSVKKQLKPFVAIVLTGIIFSYMHGLQRMLPLIPVGIMLTWVMFRTKSILIPMLIHILFNSTSVVIQFFGKDILQKTTNMNPESLSKNQELQLAILVIIVLVSLASYNLLTKYPHKRDNEI